MTYHNQYITEKIQREHFRDKLRGEISRKKRIEERIREFYRKEKKYDIGEEF